MEEEKIKILVVDDIEQTRVDIKRLLYFEEDMEIVGEAADGQEALEMVKEYVPNVILMDINMPVMDGIASTEAITMQYPWASVIIISIQGEQEYLKKAMAAGAREYLVKPLSSEEMASTIRHVYKLNKRMHTTAGEAPPAPTQVNPAPANNYKVISFFCGKGGIGKTTLASNLAVALAKKDLKVALLDLDLQFGDISVMFNLHDTRSISDLTEEEEINAAVLDDYLIQHISGVFILGAPLWPQDAEKVTPEHIQTILDLLRESFDCVIVDTSAFFSDINLLALESSDLIFLPVRRDISTIKNVKAGLDILKSLELDEKVKLILNQSDLDLGVDTEELQKALDSEIAHEVSSDEKIVLSSINEGNPFTYKQNASDIGRAIEKLGGKIINGFNNVSEPGRKTPLFRLFSF